MLINEALFSSNKEDWETPPDLFAKLDKEFHFDLDACALPINAKCKKYYTPDINGLLQDWKGCVWYNPPYGREINKWVQKAKEEHEKNGTKVVMLLPARTDTKWFHDYIYGNCEIRFLKGRLKFVGAKNGAPFPSMIAIFK